MAHNTSRGNPGDHRDPWKDRAELLLRWAWFLFEVVKCVS